MNQSPQLDPSSPSQRHQPSDPSRKRRNKRRWLIALLVLILLLGGSVALLSWMIAPQRQPGLAYTGLDMQAKIIEMVKQKKPEITLSPAEFNDLAREELMERAARFPAGVHITGADFSWKGNVVQADVRGSLWGIPFGALLDFDAQRQGNALVLSHVHTMVKHGAFNWPHLQPISISLNKYVPAIVEVSDLQFGDQQLTVTFKLDLFTLPRLLWR
ncbi:hypothetical protein [Paenibacillus sp. WLX2291]|uniref:hypothetical protein n=1 Tax=Paenibacillus sp. WLX2291 TaxID=3296934 RepID=UPI003983E9F1